jgi:hypothetical protein
LAEAAYWASSRLGRSGAEEDATTFSAGLLV